jgi:hypothetical protein
MAHSRATDLRKRASFGAEKRLRKIEAHKKKMKAAQTGGSGQAPGRDAAGG